MPPRGVKEQRRTEFKSDALRHAADASPSRFTFRAEVATLRTHSCRRARRAVFQDERVRSPFEPPREREFDAVGFGLNAVDHLVVVPTYPEFDTKVRLVEHVRAAGGQTATTLAGLCRLGWGARSA